MEHLKADQIFTIYFDDFNGEQTKKKLVNRI